MPDDAPASDYEARTREAIYAFPFRKASWLAWRDYHRARYQALAADLAKTLNVEPEAALNVLRRWL